MPANECPLLCHYLHRYVNMFFITILDIYCAAIQILLRYEAGDDGT